LNLYIKTQASQDMRNYYAVIFTAMEEGGKKIMGFYTLSNTGVILDAIPNKTRGKLPKYPEIPAIRLGRLAVDKSVQGMNLGSELLADAIYRSMNSAVGWAIMTVDAKDEKAAAFYKRFGFAELDDDRLHLFIMRYTLKNFIEKLYEAV
jgi:ribosomal protein S18 acetylase RimI-like enzyme